LGAALKLVGLRLESVDALSAKQLLGLVPRTSAFQQVLTMQRKN